MAKRDDKFDEHEDEGLRNYRPHYIGPWLKRQGRSQRWLGEQLGKPENTVGRWCRYESTPDVSEIYRCARAMGITLAEIQRRPAPKGAPDLYPLIENADAEFLKELSQYAEFLKAKRPR